MTEKENPEVPQMPSAEEAPEPAPTPLEEIPADLPQEQAPEIPVEELSKDESRARGFLRTFFRWALGVLAVFGLGFVTALVLFYQPKVAQLDQQSRDLSTAQTQIAALEAENQTLSSLKDTNQTLEGQLDIAEAHIQLLSAMVDVSSAQLKVAAGDSTGARLQLKKTTGKLGVVSEKIEAGQKSTIDTMIQRINLVLDELDKDSFAAQSDLDVLGNSMFQFETQYFTVP